MLAVDIFTCNGSVWEVVLAFACHLSVCVQWAIEKVGMIACLSTEIGLPVVYLNTYCSNYVTTRCVSYSNCCGP